MRNPVRNIAVTAFIVAILTAVAAAQVLTPAVPACEVCSHGHH